MHTVAYTQDASAVTNPQIRLLNSLGKVLIKLKPEDPISCKVNGEWISDTIRAIYSDRLFIGNQEVMIKDIKRIQIESHAIKKKTAGIILISAAIGTTAISFIEVYGPTEDVNGLSYVPMIAITGLGTWFLLSYKSRKISPSFFWIYESPDEKIVTKLNER